MRPPNDSVGHNRVQAVAERGRVVTLEDGTRWVTVEADDRPRIASWDDQPRVWVTWDKFGSGDYLLVREDTKESGDAICVRFDGPPRSEGSSGTDGGTHGN